MRSSLSGAQSLAGKRSGLLRADVPEALGSARIGVVPAVARSRRRTRPRCGRSRRDEAEGRSGRDRAARTPSVCGAYPAAGASTDPDTRAIPRRANHGSASDCSHATTRPARNSTATPDDDHLLDIAGSKILEFCAWHWTAQCMGRCAERHRRQRQNNCGRTSHGGLRFWFKFGQLFSVRPPFCSFHGRCRDDFSANGGHKRSPPSLKARRRASGLRCAAAPSTIKTNVLLRSLRKSAHGCAGRRPRTTVPS
jgi:hypothetical protein